MREVQLDERHEAKLHLLVTDDVAERAVLGQCLLHPETLAWIELEPEAFANPRWRAVFEAMRWVDSQGVGVDEITLEAELARAGKLQAVGGLAALAELATSMGVHSNVDHYVQILRDRAVERELVQLGGRIEQLLRSGVQGADLLDEAMGILSRVDRPKEDLVRYLEDMALEEAVIVEAAFQARRRGEEITEGGFPLPTPQLQSITGGAALHTPIVIGARPGVGKSSFLLAWCRVLAKLGMPGSVFSWEDRGPIWAQRYLAGEARIDSKTIRTRSASPLELADLCRAAAAIAPDRRPRMIRFESAHGWGWPKLKRALLADITRRKITWACVDYLQLIPGDKRVKRNEQIDDILREMSAFAGEHGITLLVACQLNREMEGREGKDRKPKLSDLRDSGAIEQHAKMAIFLADDPARQDALSIHLLKHTVGEAQGRVVDIKFRRDFSIMEDF